MSWDKECKEMNKQTAHLMQDIMVACEIGESKARIILCLCRDADMVFEAPDTAPAKGWTIYEGWVIPIDLE